MTANKTRTAGPSSTINTIAVADWLGYAELAPVVQ